MVFILHKLQVAKNHISILLQTTGILLILGYFQIYDRTVLCRLKYLFPLSYHFHPAICR